MLLKRVLLTSIILTLIVLLSGCVSSHQSRTPESTIPFASQTISSPVIQKNPDANAILSTPFNSPITTNSSVTPTVDIINRPLLLNDPVISSLPTKTVSGANITRHNYFDSGEEFSFRIQVEGSQYNDLSSFKKLFFQAKFIANQITRYDFETVDTHLPFNLSFSSGMRYDLKLIPGTTYCIFIQLAMGFPSAYGLIISNGPEIIFAGVTDWCLDGIITIDNGFFPIGFPSMNVIQKDLMRDNYYEYNSSAEFTRITNLEIQFFLNDKIFTMHQGQSADLGDYKVDLLFAISRNTQYKVSVADGGINTFSFVIAKRIKSIPTSIQSAAYDEVKFADPSLDAVVRKALNFTNKDITRIDLVTLNRLEAVSSNITNLSGIEKCLGLWQLNLSDNPFKDLSPLSYLTALERLEINHSSPRDPNKIKDISSFKPVNPRSLKYLYLFRNEITDITPISNETELSVLDISDNKITDISALSSLTKLDRLNLSFNQISDISALSKQPFYELKLAGNKISDIKPLVNNTRLQNGTKIDLIWNPLNQKSINEYIPELQKRNNFVVNY
jgi:hypothetical protein